MSPATLSPISNGFRVEGCVAFENVVSLRSLGEQWLMSLSSQTNPVEIDLSGMKDQDASSISLLLCWMRFAKKKGLRLHLIAATPSLQRMANMFGLTEIVWANG